MIQQRKTVEIGPLKRVFAPHLGRHVVFGRLSSPLTGKPLLRFRDYIRTAALPAPPASIDYTTSASASLEDIYGNDSLGDCVIAALFHLLGVWTGNATGTPFVATLDQIIAMYSAIGGYVPGDPSTDQGCDMQTAMDWIVANGFPNGDKPLGYVSIDASNFEEVCQAIWLFEGVDLGMSLPDAWINPFPSSNGFVWDAAGAPNPANGHSIMAAGYDSTGITIDTWALLGKMTPAALNAYATANSGGQLFVLLSADMVAKGVSKAPNGIDWGQLVTDFIEMGGNVPAPVPPPAPPAPPPDPGPPPAPPPGPPFPDAPVTLGEIVVYVLCDGTYRPAIVLNVSPVSLHVFTDGTSATSYIPSAVYSADPQPDTWH